jgi:hypothetical protein
LTTENYIHNGSAVDQATGQAVGQQASIAFDFGSNISWTAGWCVFAWQYFAAPTNIATWANGGMRIGIGSSLSAVQYYNAVGSDFGAYPYGGWQNTAIDPTLSADQTGSGGSNGGNYRYFGSMCNMLAKITKGSPHAIDAYRYGRGQIKAIGTGANFTDLAAANDASTARWGLFSQKGGTFSWKGLLSLGDASNSVTFADSNRAIFLEDTPRVSAGFNKIEIRNAGSSVTGSSNSISGIQTSITGSAPVSRGDLEVVDNATVEFTAWTFTDLGTFILKSNTTAEGTTWRRCGTITLNGATLTDCLITNSHAAVSVSAATLNNMTGCTFNSDGSNHAIDLGTVSSSTTMTWQCTATGYASSNGSSGNEVIKVSVASGQTLTINVAAGYSAPSYYNLGTGSVSVVTGQTTITIAAQVSLSGAEVRIYDDDGASGSFGTELDGVESNSASTYQYTGTQANSIIIQVMLAGYEEYLQTYTIPSVDTTLNITLTPEENA